METHKDMTNAQVGQLLREIAAAYEVLGEDRFRLRAYDTAAESIEKTTAPLKDLWQQHQLEDIPGIGSSLAGHLDELFTTGRVNHFDSIKKKLPPAMFELLDVPGIGPKTALKLTQNLNLKPTTARSQLLQAAQAGKISHISGFGEESQQDIIQALRELPQAHQQRILLIDAEITAQKVIDYLKKNSAVREVAPLGSLRRRNATVGDIDLAVATTDSQTIIQHFLHYPGVKQVLAAGENTARIIDHSDHQIDIKTVPPANYGALLQHFTGSKAHNVHLRELALQKGWSLSEYGIKIKGKLHAFAQEADFYAALRLPWIPPELREDTGEIEAALNHRLPSLVELKHIQGDLHTHTNFNWHVSHDPGINSIEELVIAATKLGYAYIGIGDHQPSTSTYKTDQKLIIEVARRTKAIEQIKSKHEKTVKNRSIKVLNTLEVDIRTDGSLALPDSALDLLDFAIVSVHSNFRQTETVITQRILKGLSHPKAKILGHPTGRLLNKRPSYDADWPKIFDFCRHHRKALEVNAEPHRLDLPDSLIRQAIKAQVKLVINTDSHDVNHLKVMPYGVATARRGWATPEDIINTWPWDKFSQFVLES
ncbi:MAG: DNA polymerase/3'-5' exonuclease PolX [Candidatus Chisholmbacteria bacterium]|nr:DNA polymerase/3'-5' exonuclease PolX [Candidatus Chisholmbacteria bacterium]